MTAIAKAIALAFLRELLGAVTGYFAARRDEATTRALGRAEAERDAAMEAAMRAEDMAGVPLPDDVEAIRRLREGSA